MYIGIGSNLGDRKYNCELAVELLRQHGISVSKRSSLRETQPWGNKDQPLFLNMAVEGQTDCAPRELLAIIKGIETRMGRTETFRWGPRTIDVDILLYNEVVMKSRELTIPHPCLHERYFVLQPLDEIAPALVHPVLKKTMRELFETFAGER
ncbi:MAG: 2-amino-4-hydroxy-6-hydroxymethyldihydropteridine diphosphokinase [Nitrospirota bacterium]